MGESEGQTGYDNVEVRVHEEAICPQCSPVALFTDEADPKTARSAGFDLRHGAH